MKNKNLNRNLNYKRFIILGISSNSGYNPSSEKLNSQGQKTGRGPGTLEMVGQRAGYPPNASKGVDPTDVHGAGSTDALSARPPQGEGWVHFVLDFKQGVQHHGATTEIQKKKNTLI